MKGIEIARRSAGGHGFNVYSGLVGPLHESSPLITLEGIALLIKVNLQY